MVAQRRSRTKKNRRRTHEEVLQERHEELESYVEYDEPQHEKVEQEEQDEGEELHEVHTLWFGLSGAGKTSSPTWS